MDELIGRQLGLYEIVSQLGTGGMANVYKAYQSSVDRHVAVKVLTRLHTKAYQIFANRFMQEAQVVAKLEHPHILPVYDFGETEDYLYLVMRLANAGTLWDRFHGQPFPLEHIRHIILQVGDALDYAHTKGIVHRDVKPKNILMDDRDNCLLTDFGIAKVMQADLSLTQMGTTVGTPTYMSPEQIQGEPLDGRTDIYALGVILFQLATGHLPFEADTPQGMSTKHLYADRPSARALNPALPAEVEAIIARAMAKNPDDRYATAGDMVQSMKDLQQVKVSPDILMDDADDDDKTTILPSFDSELFASDRLATADLVEETVQLDDLQPANSSNNQVPAGLDDQPDGATPVVQNAGRPATASLEPAQAPINGGRVRSATPAPFPVGPDAAAQGAGQNRWIWLFGVIGILIIILLGVLIGISLSQPETPVTSEAFAEIDAEARNFVKVLEDDFSEPRLEITELDDENGVARSYEAEQFLISVDPSRVSGDPTETLRAITFVDDSVYENFMLAVELVEKNGNLADRDEIEDQNFYGVTFRNQGRNFYSLEVTGSGSLKLFKVSAEEELNIASSPDGTIEPGRPIKLQLEAVGPEFTVTVNDEEYNFTDPAPDEYLKQGGIGFVVNPADNRPATAAFDNLEIWTLESAEE